MRLKFDIAPHDGMLECSLHEGSYTIYQMGAKFKLIRSFCKKEKINGDGFDRFYGADYDDWIHREWENIDYIENAVAEANIDYENKI
jgi:hypothetical protein